MADLKQLTIYFSELDEDEVTNFIDNLLEENATEEDAIATIDALKEGMDEVGDLFESGEYFVGDLIYAGEILTDAIERLKPILSTNVTEKSGKIILGTVHGDLHDIGKNIFKNMIEIAGFEVYDLGIDVTPEAFVEKVKEVQPQVIGMSGVLTLALDSMKKTVEALTEAGLRDSVKVIIGGNPVTQESCDTVGADAFTTNASEGVKLCKAWL